MDCEQEYHLCSEADVRAYPTVKLYLGAPGDGMTQVSITLSILPTKYYILLSMVVLRIWR